MHILLSTYKISTSVFFARIAVLMSVNEGRGMGMCSIGVCDTGLYRLLSDMYLFLPLS